MCSSYQPAAIPDHLVSHPLSRLRCLQHLGVRLRPRLVGASCSLRTAPPPRAEEMGSKDGSRRPIIHSGLIGGPAHGRSTTPPTRVLVRAPHRADRRAALATREIAGMSRARQACQRVPVRAAEEARARKGPLTGPLTAAPGAHSGRLSAHAIR